MSASIDISHFCPRFWLIELFTKPTPDFFKFPIFCDPSQKWIIFLPFSGQTFTFSDCTIWSCTFLLFFFLFRAFLILIFWFIVFLFWRLCFLNELLYSFLFILFTLLVLLLVQLLFAILRVILVCENGIVSLKVWGLRLWFIAFVV